LNQPDRLKPDIITSPHHLITTFPHPPILYLIFVLAPQFSTFKCIQIISEFNKNYLCGMKVRSNLLKEIKNYYLNEIANLYGINEAESMLNLLINHFFGLNRTGQLLKPDFRLTETEMLKLHFAVKELKKEKPVQYIVGNAEFYGMNLKVNPSVLIPRPETEELVDKIVKANVDNSRLKVLDIGTGSGCIALALKSSMPDSSVVAVDVSEEALAIAEENKHSLALKVEFQKLNILDASEWHILKKFDIIVSNPPYVTVAEKSRMRKNVFDNEPSIALFVTDDEPLVFYNAITDFAQTHLNRSGVLWFEINEKFGEQVKDLMAKKGFSELKIYPDIHKKERFVSGRLNYVT